jgi:hypothetical protein
MTWMTGVFAVALAIGGMLAYRGVWRSWALRPLGYGTGFMLLYLAIAIGGIQVSALIMSLGGAAWLAAVFLALGTASLILAVVSLVWLPRFLTPAWFRSVRAR